MMSSGREKLSFENTFPEIFEDFSAAVCFRMCLSLTLSLSLFLGGGGGVSPIIVIESYKTQ